MSADIGCPDNPSSAQSNSTSKLFYGFLASSLGFINRPRLVCDKRGSNIRQKETPCMNINCKRDTDILITHLLLNIDVKLEIRNRCLRITVIILNNTSRMSGKHTER